MVAMAENKPTLASALSIVEAIGAREALRTYENYLQMRLARRDNDIAIGEEDPVELGPVTLGVVVCKRLRYRYPQLVNQFDAIEKELREKQAF